MTKQEYKKLMAALEQTRNQNELWSEFTFDEFQRGIARGLTIAINMIKEVTDDGTRI